MTCIAVAAFSMTVLAAHSPYLLDGFGTPRISRFHDGADAAVSLQFDDSMTSQLANALPLLNARGIRATFFVNTESYQYKSHQKEWEVDVLLAGHELGNHTAHHSGAKSLEELTKEIGDCSLHLQKVYGPKPRLMSFATPGGVPWNFTQAQLDPIFRKYLLVRADNRNFFDEKQVDPVTFVQKAIDSHSATNVSMHGTGGEWLSTSLPNLTRLLDFIVAHRPKLWVAPEIEVYKYVQERNSASSPILSHANGKAFSLEVNCDAAKLFTGGLAASALYDQPLSVEVKVPASWKTFRVVQGTHTARVPVQADSIARFDVWPNQGPARVAKTQQ